MFRNPFKVDWVNRFVIRGRLGGCKALTSVTIQEGVTRIGAMAFGDCRALTSVTIPQSVMEIGQWAFSNDQLTVKCLPTSPPSPSSPAPFTLKKLYVPASSVDSYKKAWEGAYSHKKLLHLSLSLLSEL